uniref:lipid phosphate phosphatase epsilon 2, chloroplastic-like n=1 Tax=Erigeron canadensis TaxID=72917 RepID=UPI001CB8F7D6|nr:lipid phosphate phosphatase epsilon 2, chloroplastic-like [Erigeron canadensis]
MVEAPKCDEITVYAVKQEVVIAIVGDSFYPTVGMLHVFLNRLSMWCITVAYCGVILSRQDNIALWAVLGFALNIILSKSLKQILNQERPVSEVCSGPGMPSTHAQSISFTVIFSILSIIGWLGLNALSVILSGLVVAVGVYFTWLRVLLRYHTTSQVVAGTIVGSIFSVLWFTNCNAMILKAYNSCL